MRISDWSSDVCSSDLPSPLQGSGLFPPPFALSLSKGRSFFGRCKKEEQCFDRLSTNGLYSCAASEFLGDAEPDDARVEGEDVRGQTAVVAVQEGIGDRRRVEDILDRKSTRLNSSH